MVEKKFYYQNLTWDDVKFDQDVTHTKAEFLFKCRGLLELLPKDESEAKKIVQSWIDWSDHLTDDADINFNPETGPPFATLTIFRAKLV